MIQEEWKKVIIDDVETYYSVSNQGRVRNDSTGRILTGTVANNGYQMVHFHSHIDKVCSVHRLVMKAFCPCPEMDDLQINHKDGNKLNNSLSNLEWSTALENMRHSYLTGLQPKKMIPVYQYDLEGKYLNEYINSYEAGKQLNIDPANILRCIHGEQTHYRTWQFKDKKFDKIAPWTNPKNKGVWVYNRHTGEWIGSYSSQNECAKAFGVAPSSISRYINGTRSLDGFLFSRVPL